MLWTPSEADAMHFFILVGGGILLLRKVAQMEGHHDLRVFILVVIFSVPVILFFSRIRAHTRQPTHL